MLNDLENKNSDNDILYQENILEHSRNPKNKKELFLTLAEIESNKNSDNIKIISEKGDNPDCGDSGMLFLKIKNIETQKENILDHLILEASFTGSGCAISQASFDMFAEELNGKLISEIKLWSPAKVYELLGIQITPSRVNCALLSYRALENVLKNV